MKVRLTRAARSLATCVLVTGVALTAPTAVLAAPGDLDTSFSDDGLATPYFGGQGASVSDVAIDSQGRIVAAGGAPHTATKGDIAIARMLPDGSPDFSFSGDGQLRTGWPFPDTASAVAIDAQGRIVVAGLRLVARFLPNGRPDPSFSGDGRRGLDLGYGGSLEDLVIDDQGRIVVAGGGGGDFQVVRLNPNGSLDTSFGSAGSATTGFARGGFAHSLAIDSRHRIIVGGYTASSNWKRLFAVARFLPDGSLDPDFSHDGRQTTAFASAAAIQSLAIAGRNRIVAVGENHLGGAETPVIARYRHEGSLDPSFSRDGKVIATGWRRSGFTPARAVAIDPAARIVVAGYTSSGADDRSFALARYTSAGGLDMSFGDDGMVENRFGDSRDVLNGVTIDQEGRIVGGGVVSNPSGPAGFAVVRYLGGP